MLGVVKNIKEKRTFILAVLLEFIKLFNNFFMFKIKVKVVINELKIPQVLITTKMEKWKKKNREMRRKGGHLLEMAQRFAIQESRVSIWNLITPGCMAGNLVILWQWQRLLQLISVRVDVIVSSFLQNLVEGIY